MRLGGYIARVASAWGKGVGRSSIMRNVYEWKCKYICKYTSIYVNIRRRRSSGSQVGGEMASRRRVGQGVDRNLGDTIGGDS